MALPLPRKRLVALALLLGVGTAYGVVSFTQTVTTTVEAADSDVGFASGAGYQEASALGFAAMIADGATASVTITGIAGGTTAYSDLVNITNTGTRSYDVSLSRAQEPDADITAYKVTGPVSWDASASPASTTFTLAPGESASLDIAVTLSASATGTLTAFDMVATMTPS